MRHGLGRLPGSPSNYARGAVCAPQATMVTSVLCILMCGYNYFLILELGSRAHILYAMKILTYLLCPFLNNTISTKSQAGFSGYHESLTCEVSS